MRPNDHRLTQEERERGREREGEGKRMHDVREESPYQAPQSVGAALVRLRVCREK